jgi:hypothetical protein
MASTNMLKIIVWKSLTKCELVNSDPSLCKSSVMVKNDDAYRLFH